MNVFVVGLATFDQMAGGSARHLSGLTAALQSRGHDVFVRTAAAYVATRGYSETGLVGQLARTIRRFLVYMPSTFVSVLNRRPDLVNTHFALDGLPAVLAASLIRTPVVVVFHGPWAIEALATGRRGRWPLSTRLRRMVERLVYRRASRCIVLSRAFGEVLVNEYSVARSRVRVIPGGLDTRRFEGLPNPSEARRQLGFDDRYTMVTVRRLVPRMAIDLAIDALAEILDHTDGQLLVAGSGPELKTLESHAQDRGLGNRVRFLGRVEDEQLPLLYAAADVCVVPSRELEGFGYVALEALAAGTPVVATGTGGLTELVGGLEPRWVTEATSEAIAGAIVALRESPASFPDAEACQGYARTMDWEAVAPQVERVFREAISGRSRRRDVTDSE